ncbi:MAG TPA: ATP-binding protein [Clostridia bacterium]|nr:ATP-binding protein [Clostridia bacterium]
MIFTENHRTEFKEILNDKIEKEIVAFLNSKEGGILYIGIKDDGTPVGVEDIDKIQLQVTDRIKNNILPPALGLFDVLLQEIDKHSIVKVIISSGTEKPYYIRNHGMSPSGCYICCRFIQNNHIMCSEKASCN